MMAYFRFHVNSMILLNLSVSYVNHMLAQLRYVSYASVPQRLVAYCHVTSCLLMYRLVQLEFCIGGLRILT